VSRIVQIWAAYLGGAYALKYREMIVIDVAFRDPNTVARKLVESFALCVVVLFCVVAVWYGMELWWKSTIRGHTTDSYLALPKWFTHASVWVGFLLLLLQGLAELVKIWTRGVPTNDQIGGAH
jgi:TRAP-type C4-dicarboxylate transport system permease small subunit